MDTTTREQLSLQEKLRRAESRLEAAESELAKALDKWSDAEIALSRSMGYDG